MKIAVGIISLGLSIIVLLQSCAANVGGALGQNESLKVDAALGFLAAMGLLVGGALAFNLPRAAALVFALCGALVLAANTGAYGDLYVWGIVMVVIAPIVFFTGRRKKVKVS